MYYKYVGLEILKKKKAYIDDTLVELYLIRFQEDITREEYNEDRDLAIPMGEFMGVVSDGCIIPAENKNSQYYKIGAEEDCDMNWSDSRLIGPYILDALHTAYHVFVIDEYDDDVLCCTFGDYNEDIGTIDIGGDIPIDVSVIIDYIRGDIKEPLDIKVDIEDIDDSI